MKGKILMGSLIALAIAFSGTLGNGDLFGIKAAFGYGGGGGGGGGSSYVYPCVNVVYAEWQNCVNGLQYRNVVSQSPSFCVLTASQQAARSQVCGAAVTPAPALSGQTPIFSGQTIGAQILGIKIYPAGSLVRTPDKKIFVVLEGNTVKRVNNLKELWAYRGQKINDVSAEVLAQYKQQILGVKIYANGTLLRGLDKKIFVIVNGKKQHIKSLKELMEYRGQKINNVSAEVLAAY